MVHGNIGAELALFTAPHLIDSATHLPALPEHGDPLENRQPGQDRRDDYERMTIGRLLISAAGYVGGFFIALAGTAYVDNNRRRLGWGLIGSGGVCAVLGLVFWLSLPMLR